MTMLKKIERLEAGAQRSNGAIALLKVFGGVALTSIITFCTWIESTNQAMHQRLSDTNQKVAVIESKIAFQVFHEWRKHTYIFSLCSYSNIFLLCDWAFLY